MRDRDRKLLWETYVSENTHSPQNNESPNAPGASGTDLRTALNGIHPEFLEQMEALMAFAQKTESRLNALEGGGMPPPQPSPVAPAPIPGAPPEAAAAYEPMGRLGA